MALTPGQNRAGAAGLPDDGNLVDHGLDSARAMSLTEQRRQAHGTGATFGAPAEKPAIGHRAPLLGVRG